ncbi:hypothetical protein VTK26DRAFT_4266 [Humicola hyalothermophila]
MHLTFDALRLDGSLLENLQRIEHLETKKCPCRNPISFNSSNQILHPAAMAVASTNLVGSVAVGLADLVGLVAVGLAALVDLADLADLVAVALADLVGLVAVGLAALVDLADLVAVALADLVDLVAVATSSVEPVSSSSSVEPPTARRWTRSRPRRWRSR